jgi:hypothetical protein
MAQGHIEYVPKIARFSDLKRQLIECLQRFTLIIGLYGWIVRIVIHRIPSSSRVLGTPVSGGSPIATRLFALYIRHMYNSGWDPIFNMWRQGLNRKHHGGRFQQSAYRTEVRSSC